MMKKVLAEQELQMQRDGIHQAASLSTPTATPSTSKKDNGQGDVFAIVKQAYKSDKDNLNRTEVVVDFSSYTGKRPVYAVVSVGYPNLSIIIDGGDRKESHTHVDLLSQMLSKHMVWVDREKLIFQGAAAIEYLLETKYVATKQEAMMVLNAMLEERLFSSTTDVLQEMPPVPVATAESEMTNDGKIRPPKPPNMMSEGFNMEMYYTCTPYDWQDYGRTEVVRGPKYSTSKKAVFIQFDGDVIKIV